MLCDTEEFDNCICITRVNYSNDVLEAAVAAALKMAGIHVDVNLERDDEAICKEIVEGWVRNNVLCEL